MDNNEMKLGSLNEETLANIAGGKLAPICSFDTLAMVSGWKYNEGLSVEECAQRLYDMGYDESTGNTLQMITDWLYIRWGGL